MKEIADEIFFEEYAKPIPSSKPFPDFMVKDWFKAELDTYTELMMDKVKHIYKLNKDDSEENIKGYYGEAFVDNLQWVMLHRYFMYGEETNRSYSIINQYRKPKYSPRGGIDKYLTIIDEIGDTFNIGIEVKNWNKYYNYQEIDFEEEILDRFKYCNPNDFKVLAITRFHIPEYKDICKENGILILRLENCITEKTSYKQMKYNIQMFLKDFNSLIEEIMYDKRATIKKLYKYGMKPEILAKVFGVSKRRIYQIIEE